jgi:hypothetical protein
MQAFRECASVALSVNTSARLTTRYQVLPHTFPGQQRVSRQVWRMLPCMASLPQHLRMDSSVGCRMRRRITACTTFRGVFVLMTVAAGLVQGANDTVINAADCKSPIFVFACRWATTKFTCQLVG